MLIGVTGNFATGKSAFMHIMDRFGKKVYYTDRMVNELYKEKGMVEKIGREFGKTIVFGGRIDKGLLGGIVFNDHEKLKKLNMIVHPEVWGKIKEINHGQRIVFVEVPLLFEAKMERLFDKIILVKCPRETAMKRASKKGYTENEFGRINSAQFPPEKVEGKADFIVDTSGKLKETRKQAEEILAKLEGKK